MNGADSNHSPTRLAAARLRLEDKLLSRFLRLPPPTNRYHIEMGERIPMRDGADLLADRFIPHMTGPAPTILIRSPYGRGYPWSQFYARPFASRGFHVVIESVRGTSGSGGMFASAVNEISDGIDTVVWLRRQPWFTGQFATIGPSYLGLTQWALMVDPPDELAAAVILAAPHDLAAFAWETGSFALHDNFGNSQGMAKLNDPDGVGILASRIRGLVTPGTSDAVVPEMPLGASGRKLLGPANVHFDELLNHPDVSDAFWDARRFPAALDRSTVPVLLVNGWQDVFLNQTLEQYQSLRDRNVEVALTIGPWNHSKLLRKGSRTYTMEALDWMNRHLLATGSTRAGRVRIFEEGRGWIEFLDWPPALTDRIFYLHSDGALDDKSPPNLNSWSTFTYDPDDPTPTIGGRMLFGGGYCRDTALAKRKDVLSFTSAALRQDLDVIGRPVLELSHSADNEHVDLAVRMSVVDKTGQSTNVSDGFLRIQPSATSAPSSVTIELDPIAHRFEMGDRIRIVLAGGSHPRFARNPGTGEDMATAHRTVPATHYVHHGADGLSRLILRTANRSDVRGMAAARPSGRARATPKP